MTPQIITLDPFDVKLAIEECLRNVNNSEEIEKLSDSASLLHFKVGTGGYYFI